MNFEPLQFWKREASRKVPKGVSFGFLGPIRLLRERVAWNDVTLDKAWVSLIEEAARRNIEGEG